MSLETSPSSTSSKSSASSTELRASISRLFQTAIDAQDVNLIAECDEAETERNFSAAIAEGAGAEPIYAVVNLKKKYALRAQQKEVSESYCFRDRPNSVHVVSSDYEEVLVSLGRKVLAFVSNHVLFSTAGLAIGGLCRRERGGREHLRAGLWKILIFHAQRKLNSFF